MSRYSEDCSSHDFFLGFGILRLLEKVPGARVLSSDGGFPVTRALAPQPKPIAGYRPDAVVGSPAGTYLVEAKSTEDLSSSHSKIQFRTIDRLLSEPASLMLTLIVFGPRPGATALIKRTIEGFENAKRVQHVFPFLWD